MADAEDRARLLRILEGHGQSFLASFEVPNLGESSKKRKADKVDITSNKRSKEAVHEEPEDDGGEEEEVWLGIGHDREEDDSCSEDLEEEEDEEGTGEHSSFH